MGRMEDPMTESELKRAFSMFDINNDGTIEVGEMSLAMREMGIDATFAEIKVLFKTADVDNNAAINFSEFCKMMKMFNDLEDTEDDAEMTEEQIKALFATFDADKSGFITPIELREAMIAMGEKVTDKEIDAAIKRADTDGDGKINYEEFI